MILLDTVVVSEFQKTRPSPRVVSWIGELRESDLFLSVVTLGEIERGIVRARDEVFRARLEKWLEDTMRRYAERILDITAPVARRWGRWSAELGRDDPDLLIAATAAVHGLTVATRNVRHFQATGVATVDPFR
ncbi:MAG: PIN domain-containing protein [Caldimonas sp.]